MDPIYNHNVQYGSSGNAEINLMDITDEQTFTVRAILTIGGQTVSRDWLIYARDPWIRRTDD